jgi:hypothetical protein
MLVEFPVHPFLPCDPVVTHAVNAAAVSVAKAKPGDLIGFRFLCWHMEGSYQKDDIEMLVSRGQGEKPTAVSSDIYFSRVASPLKKVDIIAFSAITRADMQPLLEVTGNAWNSSLNNGFDLLEVSLLKDAAFAVDDAQDYDADRRNHVFLTPAKSAHDALRRQPDICEIRNLMAWSAVPHQEMSTVSLAPFKIAIA